MTRQSLYSKIPTTALPISGSHMSAYVSTKYATDLEPLLVREPNHFLNVWRVNFGKGLRESKPRKVWSMKRKALRFSRKLEMGDAALAKLTNVS